MELRIENVWFQDKHDWDLVAKAIDYSLFKTFSVSTREVYQPRSACDVDDFLVAQLIIAVNDCD